MKEPPVRLQLHLSGVRLCLKIADYRPSDRDAWDRQWCRTQLFLSCLPWLDYVQNAQTLLCCEIEQLTDSLGRLLEGRLTEETRLSFLEPDFCFLLHPEEITMEWKIYFWSQGAVSGNFLSLALDRQQIQYFYNYLRILSYELDMASPAVIDMLYGGSLLPE